MLVEFVRMLLGVRLGRDDERVDVRTGCSGAVRILQFDGLIGGGVRVADTGAFRVEVLTTVLE